MERTKRIRNGEKASGNFSKAEMERRLTSLRRHMTDSDIGGVLLTSMHNIHYYSDFLYCSFGRPYGLIVTQDKAVTISANIDFGQPWRRTHGDNLVYTDWRRDSYYEAVRREAPATGRIGMEFDHLSLEVHEKLRDALPGADLVDIAAATMTMRTVKSPEEIVLIKDGARIADIGGAACVEAIGEGVPEHEVALHATNAMVREIAAAHPQSEIRDTWTWLQSGINTDGAHNPVTTRRIAKGDILSLNCFPMIAGYYTALERTLFFASATDREIALWEINCQVHRRGCELIQPGARCCDIANALNEIFLEHGLLENRTFGYGHSFGVLSHYYGREAGLELREDIETVLVPGMVVSMEPMITIPQGEPGAGGYREHDILVVTEAGAENITKFPFGPEHNIIGA
jgi:creatinase